MAEEKKEEAVLEEGVEELKAEEQPQPEVDEVELKKKAALTAFILAVISSSFAFGGFFVWELGFLGGLAGIICGAIAMKKAKVGEGVEVNPFKVFNKIGKILGLVGLILGIVTLVLWFVSLILGITIIFLAVVGWGIYMIVEIAVPMIEEAMATMLVLLPL